MQKWCFFVVLGLLITACTALPAARSPVETIYQMPTLTIAPSTPPVKSSPTHQPATTSLPTPEIEQTTSPVISSPPAQATQGVLIPHLQEGQPAKLESIQMINSMYGWGTTGHSMTDAHILNTVDGGQTWQDVTPDEPASSAEEDGKQVLAFFQDELHAWAAYWTTNPNLGPVFNPQIWYTVDGGQSWQRSAPIDISAWEGGYSIPAYFDFVDLQDGFLALSHDPGAGQAPVSIYRTQDGGASWNMQRAPMDQSESYLDACCQTGMAFSDASNGLVTKDPGPVGRTYLVWTHDGGLTWENLEPPPADRTLFESGLCGTASPLAVPGGMLRMVVSCLQDATPGSPPLAFLYNSSDTGRSWTYDALPDPPWDRTTWPSLRRTDQIAFNDSEHGWLFTVAAQENPDRATMDVQSYVYRTSDGGKSWQASADLPGAGQFSFPDRQNGWALTHYEELNTVQQTSDGGSHWTPLNPIISNLPTNLAPKNLNPIVQFQSGQDFRLERVNMAGAQLGWGITQSDIQDGHILYTEDGGAHWRDVTPPEPASGASASPKRPTAFFLDATHAWVTYYPVNASAGKPAPVWRTEDGGRSWSAGNKLAPGELEGGFYPGYFYFIDPSQGWLLLEHGVAAGSQPVTLYQTQDGGQTWMRSLDLLSPGSLAINTCCQSGMLFIDPLNGLITTSFGPDPLPHVSWTHDGGKSWERQDLPLPSSALSGGFCGTVSPVYAPSGPIYLLMECQNPGAPTVAASNYLFSTSDLGKNWSFVALPEPGLQNGNWHYNRRDRRIAFTSSRSGWLTITDFYESGDGQRQKMFTHLYQTKDGGQTWSPMATVNWAGEFSFVDTNLGWAIARDYPDQYAFVHTGDGGRSWQIIQPAIQP